MSAFFITYHPSYDVSLLDLEHLHPLDVKKYSNIWQELQRDVPGLYDYHLHVDHPVSHDELKTVHNEAYIDSLQDSQVISDILGISEASKLPALLLENEILKPMRWAVKGSIVSAVKAIVEGGLVVNLSGGYHQAGIAFGKGFSLYSDIAMLVKTLIQNSLLSHKDTILYIDLSAMHGSGVLDHFYQQPNIKLFDMYNRNTANASDKKLQERLDYNLPLYPGCRDDDYLSVLQSKLPKFLTAYPDAKFAIYNAGTDVYHRDLSGGLMVSKQGILLRDLFVFNILKQHAIPSVILLSNGYSEDSYRIISESLARCWLHD